MADNENADIRIHRMPKGKENPYFLIPRSTAQDETISYEALGLLTYLLSKPDGWVIRASDISRRNGKHKTYRMIKELINAGYIVRHEHRERGRVSGYTYDIYELPLSDFQEAKKLEADLPHTENQDIREYRGLQSTEIDNRDKDSAPPVRDGADGKSSKSAKGKKQATKVEPDKPEVPALTADEYARFLKGIEYTFQVGDVRVNNIYHMLRGSSKKNGYKQYNLSPVMTLEELRQYADWRKRTYDQKLTPVQSPEKIADDISIFRKEQRAQALASIPPPAELFEDYSQYAPADGDIDLDLGYEDE